MRTVGRLMLGGFFIMSGISHFKKTKDMAGYAAAKGVPQPDVAVQVSGAMMLLGGTMLALGVKPKIGALLIAGFLGGVSPVMHNFWAIEDPAQKMNDEINFMKNMALLGAALAIAGAEAKIKEVKAEREKPRERSRERGLLRKRAA
ncbi:MAG: DoxX family protein [Terriglobales bacterium]